MSLTISESVRCECGSDEIEIVIKKTAIFKCKACGQVWKCPEMEILDEQQ
ncbi:hypothetical protein LCGC14_1437740 [marine sediment metagenome]|uniref:Uncharacterized protein n=1 Tax=marine sediment metagenome TaxID=412755 RepID=A0A0F9JM70_9ZZZZ